MLLGLGFAFQFTAETASKKPQVALRFPWSFIRVCPYVRDGSRSGRELVLLLSPLRAGLLSRWACNRTEGQAVRRWPARSQRRPILFRFQFSDLSAVFEKSEERHTIHYLPAVQSLWAFLATAAGCGSSGWQLFKQTSWKYSRRFNVVRTSLFLTLCMNFRWLLPRTASVQKSNLRCWTSSSTGGRPQWARSHDHHIFVCFYTGKLSRLYVEPKPARWFRLYLSQHCDVFQR